MTYPTSASVGSKGVTEPFFLQLARGQIPGHRVVVRAGINFDLDTPGVASIWDQGGLYVYPAAATLMTLSSTSAADTAAGTGARTVLVTGLDANYAEIQETVTLNGLTAVATVNQFLRIFGATVLTAGSGGTAAGSIYVGTGVVTAGVPATIYAKVTLGFNTTQMSQYTVPAGYTAYLADVSVSAIASAVNQSTLLSFRVRPFGGIFSRSGSLVVNGGLVNIEYAVPRGFPEKMDIDGVAGTSDTNVVITAATRFILVSNSLGD